MPGDGNSTVLMSLFGAIDDLREWCSNAFEIIYAIPAVCREFACSAIDGFRTSG